MTELFNKKERTKLRKKLRKEMPKGEWMLWYRIRNNQLGYKFRRQFGIGKYVVDFYCPKLKFAIEVDGLSHDYEDTIEYDKIRQKYIESLGIKVKRYNSQAIFEDLDSVVDDIWYTCRELDEDYKEEND